jgi:cyclic pyranopterin phosphate synthase
MPDGDGSSQSHLKAEKILQHSDLLSYEELLRVVRLAVALGMTKIRLTGGEPLVRNGVLDFIHQLSNINGMEEVRITTNGVLLAEYAGQLYNEGVRHLNVSLDTLSAEKFKKITGKDLFSKVWQGLETAKQLGFKIKVNVVAMKGINDDEFCDFANLALDQGFQVRFIEFMPVGAKSSWEREKYIKADEIKKLISTVGTIKPFNVSHGAGPARMFELQAGDGRKGSVGFISPISHHFCDQCNRLRLTSEGRLRSCLLNDQETDLKVMLRGDASDQEISEQIRHTILNKPQGHTLENDLEGSERLTCAGQMSRIGG